MRDLDESLRAGPLRVRSVWTPERSERVARRALRRKRVIALSSALICAGACVGAAYGVVRVRAVVAGDAAPEARAVAGVRTLRFADGSIAEPFGPADELRVEEQTARRVRVRLTGSARFEVSPNRARSFEVRSGDVLVRVLGTAFSVDRRDARTRVGVEHGRVQVSWPGGSAILIGGELATFPPEPDNAAPIAAAPEVPADAAAVPDARAASGAQKGARTARDFRDWARRGEYARAYAALQAAGGGTGLASAADLMLAADVARLSAHPQAAIAPLRELCARYPKDKRAPVAAFTLGRVLLDDLGRAAEAADAFERAQALWPSGPLAEAALARAAEAWRRAQRSDRARVLAEEYVRRFPQGRHAAAMRAALTP